MSLVVAALAMAGGGGADPGACGPSSNPCQSQSFRSPPVPFGSLGACTVARAGTTRPTTDAGFRWCNAGAWQLPGAPTTVTLVDGGVLSTEPLTATGTLALTDDGGTVNVSLAQPQLLLATSSDGLAWTGTNTRGVIAGVGRPFTVDSFAFFGSEGTGSATISWGVLNLTDGGLCSASFLCTNVCPDAGSACSVPLTGHCSFSAGDLGYGNFLGGNGCSGNPASVPLQVWGTVR